MSKSKYLTYAKLALQGIKNVASYFKLRKKKKNPLLDPKLSNWD